MKQERFDGAGPPDGGVVRVAQVVGKLTAGGVEAVVNNYYRQMDRSRCQFDYYIDADSACPPARAMEALGARYFTVPPYQHLPGYMAALWRHFRAERYQIVHVHMNALSVFALAAAWAAGVPVRIVHSHSTAAPGERVKNLLKYILRPFAGVFATDRCACSKKAAVWLFGRRQSCQRLEVVLYLLPPCIYLLYFPASALLKINAGAALVSLLCSLLGLGEPDGGGIRNGAGLGPSQPGGGPRALASRHGGPALLPAGPCAHPAAGKVKAPTAAALFVGHPVQQVQQQVDVVAPAAADQHQLLAVEVLDGEGLL